MGRRKSRIEHKEPTSLRGCTTSCEPSDPGRDPLGIYQRISSVPFAPHPSEPSKRFYPSRHPPPPLVWFVEFLPEDHLAPPHATSAPHVKHGATAVGGRDQENVLEPPQRHSACGRGGCRSEDEVKGEEGEARRAHSSGVKGKPRRSVGTPPAPPRRPNGSLPERPQSKPPFVVRVPETRALPPSPGIACTFRPSALARAAARSSRRAALLAART